MTEKEAKVLHLAGNNIWCDIAASIWTDSVDTGAWMFGFLVF